MASVTSTSSPPPPQSIGVIICSTRQPRVCPQIAAFVTDAITKTQASATPAAILHTIDLAAWNLPLFDEPTIPSQITNHNDYGQPHTRAWSVEIQKYMAFIFVLPQYNWGYPAAVKNAIDYLYHEWQGKPAMIVSYGGHGGTKAAAQLRQVLLGVRMLVADTMPALSFPSKKTLFQAAKGEELHLLEEAGRWEEERKDISKAFGELMALVSQSQTPEES